MVETVWSESSRPSLTVYPPESHLHNFETLAINTESSSRRESLLSPSSGRRTKQHRGINCKYAAADICRLYLFRMVCTYITSLFRLITDRNESQFALV